MPDAAGRPDPSLELLLLPKWLTARSRTMAGERGRGARHSILGGIGLLFWAFIFAVLYKLLVYFRSVPDLGPFLAGKLLGLILVGFFSILLLSNIITALSSFFLAKDLDLLVAAPLDWLPLYLLWSTAAAAFVIGALLHRALYMDGFSKALSANSPTMRGRMARCSNHLFTRPRMAVCAVGNSTGMAPRLCGKSN